MTTNDLYLIHLHVFKTRPFILYQHNKPFYGNIYGGGTDTPFI